MSCGNRLKGMVVAMLNERLKAALESASQLPAEVQEKVAAQIESAVRNALWDAQLHDPQYDDVISELIAAAEREEPLPQQLL